MIQTVVAAKWPSLPAVTSPYSFVGRVAHTAQQRSLCTMTSDTPDPL
jgi:hypothetical protein